MEPFESSAGNRCRRLAKTTALMVGGATLATAGLETLHITDQMNELAEAGVLSGGLLAMVCAGLVWLHHQRPPQFSPDGGRPTTQPGISGEQIIPLGNTRQPELSTDLTNQQAA